MEPSAHTENTTQKNIADSDEKELTKIAEIIRNSDINEGDQKRIFAYMHEEEFKGPLPHPQILRQYEEVYPGLANEIINMALKEQNHRQELEKMLVVSEVSLNSGQLEIIKSSIKLKTRLQIFGFLCTIILLALGSACIFYDKNMGGIVSFILAIGSFCWTMFYGKKGTDKRNDKENDEENE